MSLKILQISKYYSPFKGGLETVVKCICDGLVKNNNEVTVICSNEEHKTKVDQIDGTVVHRLFRWGVIASQPILPTLFFKILKQARKSDIVHIHSPNPLAELCSMFIPKNIPIVVTYHSDVIRQKRLKHFYKLFLKFFLRRARRIIVFTDNHIKYSYILPTFKEKCSIIPLGINTDKYVISETIQSHIHDHLNRFNNYLLFVGRLVGYKGIDILLKAMQSINCNLVIVGTGDLEQELKSLAIKLGIQDKIFFLDEIKDYDEFSAHYHACKIFVLPSVSANENFGVVQLEAMFCKKPVVTTNLKSGVPVVGEKDVTTKIVTPGDHQELASAINTLLTNEDQCREMGEAGHKRVKKKYELSSMINAHINLYNDVISNK